MIASSHVRVAAKALLLTAALGLEYTTCAPAELDCEHAVRAATDSIAVLVCEREYARTSDPATGARLANSLRRSGDLMGATAIANGLLATTARADAMQVLGKIAVTQRRLDDGRKLLETARELHVIEARVDRLAMDDQALADIYYRQERYGEALRALDACITESIQADDPIVQGYCHLAAGHILGESGYFDGAQQELARAEPLLSSHRDLAELAAERGELDQLYEFGPLHQNYNAQAVVEFQTAIEHAKLAERSQRVMTNELNLVYSLAEIGRLDEATKHLDEARVLDVAGTGEAERSMLAARIAYHRHDFALASDLDNRVYDKLEEVDEQLNVAAMQARIALATGDMALAEVWANRGIEAIEKRRSAQALEMRPWVLSLRRQPYELLFTALVRAHRFEDALVAFDHWHARTLLDASSERAAQPSTLQIAAVQTETLRRLFPVWSSAPIMQPLDRGALVARLAKVDLIALVIAEDEVWRITVHDGAIAIIDVGAIGVLEPRLAKFEATPTDLALAESLGAELLGEAAFRGTDTLHVLLDGRLSSIPVAALRANGRPLIAARPIVRPPRLGEVDCVAPIRDNPRAVVIANASGDLGAAADEASEIAKQFGVAPLIGPAATRAALLSATDVDILHVAVHATIDLGGGSLVMHDQPVSALELVGHRTPPLVVLSACSSAASDDNESATSLATAFLAGGSKQVIATLRPVTDAGARELTRELYRGGIADPVRELASVQAKLAQTDNADWPNFVIFGHDVCRKGQP